MIDLDRLHSRIRNGTAFTLIELLVVISIIGVLIAISFVGFQKSREAARDGRRKADLETLRSALELYRNECGVYPAAAWIGAVGATLTDCSGNTLVQSRPGDPANPTRVYDYEPAGGGYKLCTSLEIVATGYDVTSCSCGTACNYSAKNP